MLAIPSRITHITGISLIINKLKKYLNNKNGISTFNIPIYVQFYVKKSFLCIKELYSYYLTNQTNRTTHTKPSIILLCVYTIVNVFEPMFLGCFLCEFIFFFFFSLIGSIMCMPIFRLLINLTIGGWTLPYVIKISQWLLKLPLQDMEVSCTVFATFL